ncbi:MAG TPA: dihydropteroate synthase [Bryobacteraceae bacterium]|nr:dihydropteroate synthase [Bryobacteraceae bacterium]
MSRKIYYWKLRDTELQLGERTLIMGVLNVTPDSFSDGGRFNDPDRAYARALELEEQGADIIDIGAESTRPGSERITADEEWQRLVPVLKRLRDKLSVPLSLDTYKSEIAERALQYGVRIFNDPSGLTFDPGLAKVAANANAGLILNHMRGTPETWAKMPPMADPVGTIAQELNATISRARLAGVDRARIVVDPGLGFGKRKEQNSEILGKLGKLAELDYPILIGASRKSFLAQQSEADTLFATAAAVAIAAFNGAHIVRVHDVKQTASVLLVADEIARMTALTSVVPEKPAAVPGVRPPKPRPAVEREERVRPTRPPLARPAAAEPAPPAPPAPAPAEARPERPPFVKREKGKFEDRGGKGGWAPPQKREFRRDDRPPKREFRPKGERPWSGPKSDRPRFEKPKFEKKRFSSFEKPGFEKPKSDRPRGEKPEGERPPRRPFRKRP